MSIGREKNQAKSSLTPRKEKKKGEKVPSPLLDWLEKVFGARRRGGKKLAARAVHDGKGNISSVTSQRNNDELDKNDNRREEKMWSYFIDQAL